MSNTRDPFDELEAKIFWRYQLAIFTGACSIAFGVGVLIGNLL